MVIRMLCYTDHSSKISWNKLYGFVYFYFIEIKSLKNISDFFTWTVFYFKNIKCTQVL